jgi:ubiquinone/menaquinone biosynthesis C-methylase UbiE
MFCDYFKSVIATRADLRNYFLSVASISKLLKTRGKNVLDIGCGFGLTLICLALLDCNNAVGIDISNEMIEGFQIVLKQLPHLNIKIRKGDFLQTAFSPNSFDVVILQESISHVRDTNLLLDKVRCVLRPGGTLYIKDSNNDLFFPTRVRSRKIWKRSESGPIDKHLVGFCREVDRLSYFEARMRIIGDRFPQLNEKTIAKIAKKTRGMYGDEIIEAAEEFMASGKLSHSASFPYRNPFTGEFPELGLNPLKLTKKLRESGFRCTFVRPVGPLGHIFSPSPRLAVLRRVVPSVVKYLPSPLHLYAFPNFRILAEKV